MNDSQQQPPMNGNDDLAKTLNDGLQFEETPMNGAPAPAAPSDAAAPEASDDNMQMPTLDPNAGNPDNEPMAAPSLSPTPPPAETAPTATEAAEEPKVHHPHKHKESDSTKSSGLDALKASALEELRPLVGRLNLPAEERFDTLLLIIRSTDDQSLLEQAHAAAKEITDDARRAQALLDVIKEIDYFSSKR